MSLHCISGLHFGFKSVICNSVVELRFFNGGPVFSNFILISHAGIVHTLPISLGKHVRLAALEEEANVKHQSPYSTSQS
jgi:hypothetical protein